MTQLMFYRLLAIVSLLAVLGFTALYFFTGKYLLAALACLFATVRFAFWALEHKNSGH